MRTVVPSSREVEHETFIVDPDCDLLVLQFTSDCNRLTFLRCLKCVLDPVANDTIERSPIGYDFNNFLELS